MTEIILGILLLASNALWAFLCFRLMDRLMSRNYVEFKQAGQIGKPEIKRSDEPDKLVVDPIDLHQAQEMNALIGIV